MKPKTWRSCTRKSGKQLLGWDAVQLPWKGSGQHARSWWPMLVFLAGVLVSVAVNLIVQPLRGG